MLAAAMPELPEVETVRRGLLPVLEGHRIVRVLQRRPDLRFPLPERFAERLLGRRVDRLDRRAKWLLLGLDDGMVLMIHLGMSGRLLIHPAWPETLGTHDHVVLGTDTGAAIVFNDARRFGAMDLAGGNAIHLHPALAALGPEPLSDDFDGPVLGAALAGRATPLKAALLDQRTVAGLGNIYVCEALWAAGLSPFRQASTVTAAEARRLATAIRTTLERAVAAGGSSLRDYVQASGELGYFQKEWAVYGREGEDCRKPRCRGVVARTAQSGRSTFHCPVCQR
jgi:formamidopyrimidine-DNA glycosylase